MVIATFKEEGALCPVCWQAMTRQEIGSVVRCTTCNSLVLLPSKTAVAAVAAAKRLPGRQPKQT